ncbi:PEP-CTERM sorting domain-containing protein [Pontiella sp.]|uniref:PEP-CTERM sorting domain-containing protein n=1 Tax=Pontiella sp. TaxID=2837462 RepID=UPI003561DC33
MTRNMILGAALLAVGAASAAVIDYSFDGTANDTGPAWQEFDNGAGTPVQDITNGTIANGGSSGSGFNTVDGVDLSSYSSFTVQIDVESASLEQGLNGSFFGITTGPDANGTDGSALYNNAGKVGAPAIGVQIGSGRGGSNIDLAFDMVGGNGSFTEISAAPTQDSMNDGFTLFMTLTDNGASDVGITVTSTGLSTNINYSGTLGVTYAAFAGDVTGNVSSQGGSIDLANYSIIPEPATLGLVALFGGGIMFIRRRFML